MSNMEPGIEMFSLEKMLKSDTDDSALDTRQKVLSAKEDELILMEALRESPQIHAPSECAQNLTSAEMARISQLYSLAPDQLIDKINSIHHDIFQLGRRESKEMTRGKLLGIFDRMAK